MRVRVGEIPQTILPERRARSWQPITGPSLRASYLLAGVAGVLFLTLLLGVLIFVSVVTSGTGTEADNAAAETTTPWWAVILTLLLFIPLHELLHLLFHPGNGRGPRSVLVLWPRKLRFGVYYDGCMTRRRWLVMRLAPLMCLGVLPTAVVALSHWVAVHWALSVSLQVLLLVNAVGSGGDIVAALLVLRQVPASADLCFHGGRAYWWDNVALRSEGFIDNQGQ